MGFGIDIVSREEMKAIEERCTFLEQRYIEVQRRLTELEMTHSQLETLCQSMNLRLAEVEKGIKFRVNREI